MANVFKQVTEPNNKVNKSSFDLSFQNNLTMQFGYLYPCFCKKVAPGTKLKIKPTFGLNFMPMMFPVQTRMRARMSFYKVRIRSVWKDYKDWFGNLKPNLVKPYLNFDSDAKLKAMASTGSLGDYLGLPTTIAPNSYGSSVDLTLDTNAVAYSNAFPSAMTYASFCTLIDTGLGFSSLQSLREIQSLTGSEKSLGMVFKVPQGSSFNSYSKLSINFSFDLTTWSSYASDFGSVNSTIFLQAWDRFVSNSNPTEFHKKLPLFLFGAPVFFSSVTPAPKPIEYFRYFDQNNLASMNSYFEKLNYDPSTRVYSGKLVLPLPELDPNIDSVAFMFPTSFDLYKEAPSPADNDYLFVNQDVNSSSSLVSLPLVYHTESDNLTHLYFTSPQIFSASASITSDVDTSVSDIDLDSSPYYNSMSSSKEKQLLIDACPFRAYEAIYNAYFRDIRNNPFMLNGQPEYNIFIPSDEGGIDNNTYTLRRRNWEPDFLTTAVPSPQQGRAPLVGITTYNDTAFLAFEAEDGKKYSVAYDYDPEAGEMKNVSFQQLADDAVVKQPRNMMDLVASGISISDLRNVNAYTKFLELNMRKGYFYKDLVEGHFDTKVRYDELNMPEFIGGTAKDVFVNPVSQTVQTSQDGSYFGALGSYAGQASVQGTADNTISVYCDEECYIIGLISVTPVANYSQLLPKHFLHRDLLDSYFPEFDNIGFQPIFYDEVCPIQAYNDNPDTLKEIFGYQRPWYDYVASTDEVHGLFRTNLRNFLINRVFATKPTLSEDFLLVDPEQVNDVFSVTQETDKILGQIYFDVTAVAPISRIAIPRLD